MEWDTVVKMHSVKVTHKNTLWLILSFIHSFINSTNIHFGHYMPEENTFILKKLVLRDLFCSSVESLSFQLRASQEKGLPSFSFGYSSLMKLGPGKHRSPFSPFSPWIFLTVNYLELSIYSYHIPGRFCLEQKQAFYQNNSNHTKFSCFPFCLLFVWVETYTCKGWENTTLREITSFMYNSRTLLLKKYFSLHYFLLFISYHNVKFIIFTWVTSKRSA